MGLVKKTYNVNTDQRFTISTIAREAKLPFYEESNEGRHYMGYDLTSKYESAIFKDWGIKLFHKPSVVIMYSFFNEGTDLSMREFHELVVRVFSNEVLDINDPGSIANVFNAMNLKTRLVSLRQLYGFFRKMHFIYASSL